MYVRVIRTGATYKGSVVHGYSFLFGFGKLSVINIRLSIFAKNHDLFEKRVNIIEELLRTQCSAFDC